MVNLQHTIINIHLTQFLTTVCDQDRISPYYIYTIIMQKSN